MKKTSTIKSISFILFIVLSSHLYAQVWTQQTDLIGNQRSYPVCFSIDGKVYCGGGYDGTSTPLSSFYVFDPLTNLWSTKTNLPSGVFGAASFSLNGKGYVVCGYNGGLSKKVYQYDPANNLWTSKTDFPGSARQECTAITLNGKAYLQGGYLSGSLTNDFWEYTPQSDTWVQKANVPGPGRQGATAFAIGGDVYCGMGNTFNSSSTLNDFYKYNTATDTWISLNNFSFPARTQAASFSLGGYGYIIGGQNLSSGITYYSEFYIYNPSTDLWSLVNNFPSSPRAYSTVAVASGDAYFGLGKSGSSTYHKDWWKLSGLYSSLISEVIDANFVYPNPACNNLFISSDKVNECSRLKIYNSLGEVVFSMDNLNLLSPIDVSTLKSGSYFIEMYNNSSTVKSRNVLSIVR